jgi:hypothetical protein
LCAVTDVANTYFYGDTNGGDTAELVLQITRLPTMQAGDFVL